MQVHFATRMNGFKSMSNMLAQDFFGGAYFQQIYLSFTFFGLQNFMTGRKFAIFRRFSVFKLSFGILDNLIILLKRLKTALLL